MTTTHLLYLHGFRSSPQSNKAPLSGGLRQRQAPQGSLVVPATAAVPARCRIFDCRRHCQLAAPEHVRHGLIAGLCCYASWVAQLARCKSVLINPAVNPARDLEKYIGEQASWHDPEEKFLSFVLNTSMNCACSTPAA